MTFTTMAVLAMLSACAWKILAMYTDYRMKTEQEPVATFILIGIESILNFAAIYLALSWVTKVSGLLDAMPVNP